MIEILGIELAIYEILLVIALIIVAPLGYWNQRKMIKKKQEIELLGDDLDSKNSNSNNDTNSSVSPEIESRAKEYIQQYQSSYPKESIQQGLLSFGITNEQALMLINKYYQNN